MRYVSLFLGVCFLCFPMVSALSYFHGSMQQKHPVKQFGIWGKDFQEMANLYAKGRAEIQELTQEYRDLAALFQFDDLNVINNEIEQVFAVLGDSFLGPLSQGRLNVAFSYRQPGSPAFTSVTTGTGFGAGVIEEMHKYRLPDFWGPGGIPGANGLVQIAQKGMQQTSQGSILNSISFIWAYAYSARWNGLEHFGYAFEIPFHGDQVLIFYPLGTVKNGLSLRKVGKSFYEISVYGQPAPPTSPAPILPVLSAPASRSTPVRAFGSSYAGGGKPDCQDKAGLESCLATAKNTAKAKKKAIKNAHKSCLESAWSSYAKAAGIAQDGFAGAMGVNAVRGLKEPGGVAKFHYRGVALLISSVTAGRALKLAYDNDVQSCDHQAQDDLCSAMADSYDDQIHCYVDFCSNINEKAMRKDANSKLAGASCKDRI